jgi:hypothetical protein
MLTIFNRIQNSLTLYFNFTHFAPRELLLFRSDVVRVRIFRELDEDSSGEWTLWNPEVHEPRPPKEIHFSKRLIGLIPKLGGSIN